MKKPTQREFLKQRGVKRTRGKGTSKSRTRTGPGRRPAHKHNPPGSKLWRTTPQGRKERP